jgi:hypothetical protein
MGGYVNVGVGASASTLTLDAGYIVDRVANLLRRADMKSEIMHWVNFAQQQLAHNIKFPELRTVAPAITVLVNTYSYALPLDCGQVDRVYYKANYASPAWGKNLSALPERFYGEPTDMESRLNVPASSRRVGNPESYIVQAGNLVLDASPIVETLPAELVVTYFKIPPDLIGPLDVPAIDKQWRQYLIWIALYWGKAALEQEDIAKSYAWDKKAEAVIKSLARRLNAVTNPTDTYDLPDAGMSDADSIF